MKKIIALSLLALALPALTFAAAPGDGTISGIILLVLTWIKWVVPVLMTVAVGYFIWGVIQFITASEEEAKKMGRTKIINGLIGLFVIVAFWGIIAVVQRTFGIQAGGTINNSNNLLFDGNLPQ